MRVYTHTGVVFLFVRDYIGLAVVVQYERSRAHIGEEEKNRREIIEVSAVQCRANKWACLTEQHTGGRGK